MLLFVASLIFTNAGSKSGAHQRGLATRISPPAVSSGRHVRTKARTNNKQRKYFVSRTIDGDTIRLSNGERVRLIGVDTPETKHPRKPVQCFGKEASAFTRKMVQKRYITLEFDWQLRDRYGRLLAYVYRSSDKFFLNYQLVRQGYGFAYTRYPFKYMKKFVAAERYARQHKLGLWGKCR